MGIAACLLVLAGISFEEHVGTEGFIREFNGLVVVGTVTYVAPGSATNANPPRVTVEVTETLRGESAAPTMQILWAPYPHDVDYEGPDTKSRVAAWGRKPMEKPPVGSKWILAFDARAGSVRSVSVFGRYAFSDEKRLWAIAEVAAGQRLATERGDEATRKRQEADRTIETWKALYRKAPIEQLARKADFVAIVKLSSYTGPVWEVETTLKGTTRGYYRDGLEFVQVPFAPENREALEALTAKGEPMRLVVFLRTLQPILPGRPPPTEVPIDPRYPFAPLTPDAEARARAALR